MEIAYNNNVVKILYQAVNSITTGFKPLAIRKVTQWATKRKSSKGGLNIMRNVLT